MRAFYRLNWSIAAKCLLVGLITGALVSVYRMGVANGVSFARGMYSFASENLWLIDIIIEAAIACGLFISWMVKKEPMASGSGIPQTEGVLSYLLKMRALPILAVRYAGGLLGAMFGLSLGREGPCVQIGAASGKLVRNGMGKGGLEENCLITAGAAAGLSAAFSAPISGMVFALEEVHRSFSPFLVISAAVGSMVSCAVAEFVFGLTPVLDFGVTEIMPLLDYLWMVPLGIAAGLIGCLTNKALLLSQKAYGKLPSWLGPVVSLLIIIPFGFALPDVLGGGDNLIAMAEGDLQPLWILGMLLLVKILVTCTSFGSGTPGGIFMPTLAIGALTGALFGTAFVPLGLDPQLVPLFAVCCMSGTFASAVKAPITGILLVVEMTGSLTHILPLAICSFVSLLVSDLLKVQPVYSVLLDRYVDKNGRSYVPKSDPDRLFEVYVQPGSILAGAEMGEVSWPSSSIVVSIQKAERSVVPRATSRIRAGDHLIATPVGERKHAKEELKLLGMDRRGTSESNLRAAAVMAGVGFGSDKERAPKSE